MRGAREEVLCARRKRSGAAAVFFLDLPLRDRAVHGVPGTVSGRAGGGFATAALAEPARIACAFQTRPAGAGRVDSPDAADAGGVVDRRPTATRAARNV